MQPQRHAHLYQWWEYLKSKGFQMHKDIPCQDKGLTLVEAEAALAIDLIRGHIDESPHAPVHAAGLQQHMGAIGVVLGEGKRIAKTVIHVSLHETMTLVRVLIAACSCLSWDFV